MKRILSIVLILAILVSLSACGNIDRGDENSKNDDDPTKKTLTLEKGKHEYSFGEEEEIRTFFDGYAKEHYDYTILTFDKERFIDNDAKHALWGDYSFYSEGRMGAQIHTWDIVEVEKISFNLYVVVNDEGTGIYDYDLSVEISYDMTENLDSSMIDISSFEFEYSQVNNRADSVSENFFINAGLSNKHIELKVSYFLYVFEDYVGVTLEDMESIRDEIIKSVLSSIDLYNPEGEEL